MTQGEKLQREADNQTTHLTEAMAAGDDEAKRVFQAMMTMQKIDIATIDAARRG